jgi:CMP/dCMP kinase
MTANTVTFAVQIGSGGFEIARLVAEQLNYRYYDWEVTSEAAKQAGVSAGVVAASEHAPSLLERIMDRLMSTGVYDDEVSIGRLSATTMSTAIQSLSSRQYRELIEQVVRQLADAGSAVIVGHASQVVLAGRSGVLKVLICGSPARRVERLAVEDGLSLQEASNAVHSSDKERGSFFKQTYGADLLGASLYDVVVNTDQVALEGAVDLIIKAAESVRGFLSESLATSGSGDEPAREGKPDR